MQAINQVDAINSLTTLAQYHQHGVVISGISGCGKTYLAKIYAKLLDISDFYIVNPIMSDIKYVIDTSKKSKTPLVICIENLDNGVLQVAYPLLKLIEDCPSYIYIVVTCNNLCNIPDTILSRCSAISVAPPSSLDLDNYAKSKNLKLFENFKELDMWKCVRGYTDIDMIYNFTDSQISYFNNLSELLKFKGPISTITWKLQHYDDNTETPIIIVIRYILSISTAPHLKKSCIDCLNDLDSKKLSQNAIITKFVMENKYCE